MKVIIGVIGEAGSGKTTILGQLRQLLDMTVIEVDKIGHLCLDDPLVKKRILESFSVDVFHDGNIDRKALGNIVFKDTGKLELLNDIMHPWILDESLEVARQADSKYVVLEGAALIEIGLLDYCHQVFYFHASKPVRRKRLIEGRGLAEDRVDSIIQVQKPVQYFADHADQVIETGDMTEESYESLTRSIRNILSDE